jgi:hypothetical protein
VAAPFAEALDCDFGLSPVTNMMPILRHSLLCDVARAGDVGGAQPDPRLRGLRERGAR